MEHVSWLLLVGVGLAGIAANLLVLITIRFLLFSKSISHSENYSNHKDCIYNQV